MNELEKPRRSFSMDIQKYFHKEGEYLEKYGK